MQPHARGYFDGIGAGPGCVLVRHRLRVQPGGLARNIDQPCSAGYIATISDPVRAIFGGKGRHEAYVETIIRAEGYCLREIVAIESRTRSRDIRTTFSSRRQTYNQSGRRSSHHNPTTWNASLNYEPIRRVRLRATQSRDSRAANFRRAHYSQVISAGGPSARCGTKQPRQPQRPCDWKLWVPQPEAGTSDPPPSYRPHDDSCPGSTLGGLLHIKSRTRSSGVVAFGKQLR